jgi:hypothetical protein
MLRPAAIALAMLSSAAFAQEREWTFDTSEEQAFLTFGVPESDDAGISFWCPLGTGMIRIFIPESRESLKPGGQATFVIKVDGASYPYQADITVNEEAGVPSLEAMATDTDPAFQALLKADRFALEIENEEDMFPLAGADFASLLRACGKGP